MVCIEMNFKKQYIQQWFEAKQGHRDSLLRESVKYAQAKFGHFVPQLLSFNE